MSDEIVVRLQADALFFGTRHEPLLVDDKVCRDMAVCWEQAADEIERLRKERDEARRIACKMEERLWGDESGCPKNGLARDHAERMGWDCFKGETP